MSNSLFFKSYLKHSLGVDWLLVSPEVNKASTGKGESSYPYAFVTSKKHQGTPLEKMLERMMVAVQQSSETIEVLFVEDRQEWQSHLKQKTASQKFLFFGDSFVQGSPGEWAKEGEHYFMQTHELEDVKKQPPKKRETWEHLQKFVGLK